KELFGLTLKEETLKKHSLSPNNYIFLIVNSSWRTKDWQREKIAALIEKINSSYAVKIVLLGTNEKKALAIKNICSCRENILNLVGKTSISDLIDIIGYAKAGTGPDSGPAHLAAALGTPYITLIGPTSSKRVAPIGLKDEVVEVKLWCRPCKKKSCSLNANMCMKMISAEDVFLALMPYLSRESIKKEKSILTEEDVKLEKFLKAV
ncbi:MAG: hypothetical protein D6780_03875, partial [Candidatus Dadabacteria bacterium]